MKGISLWQPWPSLIAVGAKTIETRSRRTKYRGPLAIQAAKYHLSDDERDGLGPDFWHAMAEALHPKGMADLPYGSIVAVVNLADCVPTTEFMRFRTIAPARWSDRELLFGDYSPGRFAWILEDVKALKTPIPFIGHQFLFDVPDELLLKGLLAC